jgi:hypothetical protein
MKEEVAIIVVVILCILNIPTTNIIVIPPGQYYKLYEISCRSNNIEFTLQFSSFNGTIDYYVYPSYKKTCDIMTTYYTDHSAINVSSYIESGKRINVMSSKTCFRLTNTYSSVPLTIEYSLMMFCMGDSFYNRIAKWVKIE